MREDLVLNRVAARQHGVFSRAQALESGLTEAQISHRLETSIWLRIVTGVYASSSSTPTWERQLHAAVLSHPGCLVAGRSAGRLHRMEGYRKSRPEILVPFDGNGRSPIARVIRSRNFESISTQVVSGFLTTTIAETILTLSLRIYPSMIERIVDRELAAGRLAVHDFDPILQRLEYAKQPGLGSLRRIVGARIDTAYQPPTSELEAHLYKLLDSPHLPPHRRQLPISFDNVTATVDAYVPAWRLIIEADGRRWHTRQADFERDRARDNAAAAAGFGVVRFDYRMLTEDPKGCLQTLLEAGHWRHNL